MLEDSVVNPKALEVLASSMGSAADRHKKLHVNHIIWLDTGSDDANLSWRCI